MNNIINTTKKQQEILNLLFRFRFLNRPQIQQFLKHNDKRATNDLLSALANKGLIKRIYKETFPEKTKPAVYYLEKGGVRFLKSEGNDQKLLHKLYYEKDRSDNFINRSIILADIYLDLLNRKDKDVNFEMSIAGDYPNHRFSEPLGTLLPHAYIEQENGEEKDCYFIEVIADLPNERIRQRLKEYLSFYESSEWEGSTGGSFPNVLMICPKIQTLIYAKRFLKRKFAEIDEEVLAIHLTTADKAKESGVISDIWEAVN